MNKHKQIEDENTGYNNCVAIQDYQKYRIYGSLQGKNT